MRISRLLLLVTSLLSVSLSAQTSAQTIEELRGGWMADIDGSRHIYYIVLRDDSVSGVFCSDCEDLYSLAFIDDGALNAAGLNFTLYHYPKDASPYQEQVQAQLENGQLHLITTGVSGRETETVFHRTPEADKVVFPVANFRTNQAGGGQPRTLPGAAEVVSAANTLGMWLWGTGPTKQYFFFREHKDGIRGMVCGPCDSVNDMAPLEQISMQGTNFHFEIVHEDNGSNFAEHGPHSNVTDAVISKNEMLISAIGSFASADTRPLEMTLLGPIE